MLQCLKRPWRLKEAQGWHISMKHFSARAHCPKEGVLLRAACKLPWHSCITSERCPEADPGCKVLRAALLLAAGTPESGATGWHDLAMPRFGQAAARPLTVAAQTRKHVAAAACVADEDPRGMGR